MNILIIDGEIKIPDKFYDEYNDNINCRFGDETINSRYFLVIDQYNKKGFTNTLLNKNINNKKMSLQSQIVIFSIRFM